MSRDAFYCRVGISLSRAGGASLFLERSPVSAVYSQMLCCIQAGRKSDCCTVNNVVIIK